MEQLKFLGRALFAALVAIFVGLRDRLKRGPVDPTWSWGRELLIAGGRAALVCVADLPPERMKALNDGGRGELPRAYRPLVSRESTRMAGRRAEVFEPVFDPLEGRDRITILYLHGGGYAMGSLPSYRAYAGRVVLATGARVVLPDYRLSTEAPFPAALDDAEAVYRELLEGGAAPERFFVGGESAGGGLTLALLQRLRDAKLPQPAGAFVISPWTDLTLGSASLQSNRESDYLALPTLEAWAQLYTQGQDPRDPLISPVFADYQGLAPLLVQVGGVEILRGDSELVVEAARKAGLSVSYQVYEHMPHAWQLMLAGAPETHLAWHEVAAFVRGYASTGAR